VTATSPAAKIAGLAVEITGRNGASRGRLLSFDEMIAGYPLIIPCHDDLLSFLRWNMIWLVEIHSV
jgi:hypothetical protein